MKITHRIPTTQYGYIELEEEVSNPQEAVDNHKQYCKLYEEKGGLSVNDWAKVRNNMLITGECNPDTIQEMNTAQRWFVNELKNALRAQTKEIDTVHHSLQDK